MMKYVWLVINWIFGVFFLLYGIALLFASPWGGLCAIGAAAILLPPVRQFIHAKTKKEIPMGIRVVAVLVLCVASASWSTYDLIKDQKNKELAAQQAKEQAEKAAQQAKEQAAKAAKLQQENFDYFSANRATIIASINQAFAEKNYSSVVLQSNRYLMTGDKELQAMNAQAKAALTAIENSAREAQRRQMAAEKKEKERKIAAENRAAAYQGNLQDVAKVAERIKSNAAQLKKHYYASPDQVKQAGEDVILLALIKANYADEKESNYKMLSQKAAALLPQAQQQSRELYASAIEQSFMESGLDVTVNAVGAEKDQLRIKYVLMSQPLVYKFRNEIKVGEQARVFGFKKVIYSDGYNMTWTEKL